jgi:protein TonB
MASRRLLSGFTASAVAHAAAIVIISIIVARAPAPSSSIASQPVSSVRLIWTASGSGRGGGGDGSPKPARAAQLPGRDSIALATRRPPPVARVEPRDVPQPQQQLALVEPTVSAGLQEVVGAVLELRDTDLAGRGPGSGPGADGGRGSGSGRDAGPGVGSDGDAAVPGNGVSWPRLIVEVKPNYTPDAMRAQVQGLVELEIVVLEDGSVGRVNIVRSLDTRFGLDQEAINAVRRWRFDPGRRLGKAVPVRVGVELSFNLR